MGERDRPRLCCHADQNGEGMHWLKPGEVCDRLNNQANEYDSYDENDSRLARNSDGQLIRNRFGYAYNRSTGDAVTIRPSPAQGRGEGEDG